MVGKTELKTVVHVNEFLHYEVPGVRSTPEIMERVASINSKERARREERSPGARSSAD